MPRPVPAILTAASPSIDVVVRNPVPYATPPADLMPVIDAPSTPMVSLGPRGRYLALVHHAPHPEVAMLARPYLALAGLGIYTAVAALS
jgi:hypothetical protein